MTDLDGLLARIPIGDIARKLGIDEATAESAVKQALPALVGGLAANAKDDAGARSLEKALSKHKDSSAAKGTASLSAVDTKDGEKIVSNVFGPRKDAVTAAVASKSTATQDIVAKVLPLIAPIVLAWVASRFTKPKGTVPAGKSSSGGGGIGDVLGGLLGSKQGSDVLGGVLGGLLGGGKR